MISNIDYMKLAMSYESYENDKTEIDPVLRSRVWGVVLVGLAMFWSIIALTICNIWIVS
ncbi:TPA: YmiA family putative membrane protein [Klebsiella pneumoniae]